MYKQILTKILVFGLTLSSIPIHSIASSENIEYHTENIDIKKTVLDSWSSEITNVPTKRNYATTSVVDGKLYVIGGGNGSMLATVEAYDPETDTWETKKPMPTPRERLTSVVVDGKIYCIGGWNGSSYLNKVEVYDPTTDSWTTKTSMPTARYGFISEAVGGKIYAIGGDSPSGHSRIVEEYNPVTDSWTTKTSMPTNRFNFSSSVIDGKIYCIGGSNGSFLNNVEVYNVSLNSWETKAPMPTARYGLSASVVDGKIYCIGGYNGSYLDTTEEYDPETNSWKTKTSMPTSRFGFNAVTIDKRIYAIGGLNTSSLSSIDCYIAQLTVEEVAINAFLEAEISKKPDDIEYARLLINDLPESILKNELLFRLDRLVPKTSTSNVDVYIKPQSKLSVSLDTNMVIFEEVTGTEDIEKLNAINLSVTSNLPYKVSAYLDTEIYNSDKSKTLDKRILNIKANSQPSYSTFFDLVTPIVLLDNQPITAGITHGIDLMLDGSFVKKCDTYKTSIRFEVAQK